MQDKDIILLAILCRLTFADSVGKIFNIKSNIIYMAFNITRNIEFALKAPL